MTAAWRSSTSHSRRRHRVLGPAPRRRPRLGDVVWSDFSRRTPRQRDAYTALAVTTPATPASPAESAASPRSPADVHRAQVRPGGPIRWRRDLDVARESDDRPWRSPGRHHVAGYVAAGSSGSSWLLLKYSGGGYLQWVRRGRGGSPGATHRGRHDGSGDVYAAGDATPPAVIPGSSLRKYSVRRYRYPLAEDLAPSAGDAGAAALVLDGDGNLYVPDDRRRDRTERVTTVKFSGGCARRWVAHRTRRPPRRRLAPRTSTTRRTRRHRLGRRRR